VKPLQRLSAAALLLAALPAARTLALPDREAIAVLPQGMPVHVEDARFFEDSTLLAMTLRNGGLEPARVSLRVVVFDDRRMLKGGEGLCVGDLLQPGTRQPLNVSLEIKNVTVHDRYVVLVEEVRTARRVYRVREPLDEIVREARKAVGFQSARLSSDERPVERPGSGRSLRPPDPSDVAVCTCDCTEAYAIGTDACGSQPLAGFTCSPAFGSCSMGFSCKPEE
jgi:hypothetical protein